MKALLVFIGVSVAMFLFAGWASDYELWDEKCLTVIALFSCFTGAMCALTITQERT